MNSHQASTTSARSSGQGRKRTTNAKCINKKGLPLNTAENGFVFSRGKLEAHSGLPMRLHEVFHYERPLREQTNAKGLASFFQIADDQHSRLTMRHPWSPTSAGCKMPNAKDGHRNPPTHASAGGNGFVFLKRPNRRSQPTSDEPRFSLWDSLATRSARNVMGNVSHWTGAPGGQKD